MVDTIFVIVSTACYPKQIESAAQSFSRSGDTNAIVSLLRQGQARIKRVPADQRPSAFSEYDPLQGALDIIEGRKFYGPATDHRPPRQGARTAKSDLKRFVETQVFDLLFWSNCVVYDSGAPARLVLTRGRLLPYLYEHSRELTDIFTGSLRGSPVAALPSAELLATADVRRIAGYLARVPAPNDEAEQKKAKAKLESLLKSGDRVVVSSQFADILGDPPSVQLGLLKRMLNRVLTKPDLAVVQLIE